MTKDDIRDARRQLGMTTAEFANALHMSRRAIQYMEAGKREVTRRTAAHVVALTEKSHGC